MVATDVKTVVRVRQLFLATDNPRHEDVDSELEAVERLCRTEQIEALARDIVRHGLNPAERFLVFPVDESVGPDDINSRTAYVTADANRRLCALKLLHDPANAPVAVREAFVRLANGWRPIDEVDVAIVFDLERRRHWLRRMHDGPQDGVGRKPWSAEQKTKFNGSRRNILAQALFDYAQGRGMMTEAERRGNFSHMARLVGNVLLAENLGVDASRGPEDITRRRAVEDFDAMLAAVIDEARRKTLGSQASKQRIDDFARGLLSLPGVSGGFIPPEPLNPAAPTPDPANPADPAGDVVTPPSPPRPPPPRRPENVRHDGEVVTELERIGVLKLTSLYYSICHVSARHHTPLVAVGIWSFLESMTASMGRTENVVFKDFLSRQRLSTYGLGSGRDLHPVSEALERAHNYGNFTKHHSVAAQFDFSQLINDMQVMTPAIVRCLREITGNG